MEISFAREAAIAHLKNDTPLRKPSSPLVNREQSIDSVSGNIKAGLRSADMDPAELLEQSVEAGAKENAINDAHDFNMARVMELLSDPLLQEDI
ncbi:hypothetical protein [Maridesulfovibrio zosterae]|uniref:hypothetical protein n=1 Tax=Maridesulfovibrio zosterae TaxID=82171 RepID=UPI00041E2B9A|nr:hypothetical protein [Maridesulfovibrio zosterae]